MNPNEAPDSTLLPRDEATGEPRPQTDTPGYYPGYSTLSQQSFWDPATRDVVTMRVEQAPPFAISIPCRLDSGEPSSIT